MEEALWKIAFWLQGIAIICLMISCATQTKKRPNIPALNSSLKDIPEGYILSSSGDGKTPIWIPIESINSYPQIKKTEKK